MDNFMDKIAQRLNSQEIIRANAQAEAQQMRRLQAQFEAYEDLLKEMQELNRKNTQLADTAKQLTEDYRQKTEQEPQEDQEAQAGLIGEIKTAVEEIGNALAANSARTEELLQQSEDFIHKENVKVYRNVQAVVVEELKNQTQELSGRFEKLEKQVSGIKPLLAAALVFAAGGAVMLAVQLLNLFGILSF